MDQQTLNYFQEKLLTLQAELLGVADLVNESSRTVDLDQTAVGRVSRIDALQMQEMALSNQHRQQEHLLEVKNALERIDEGVYGLCIECDEAIVQGRLEINPAVEYCINCAD